MRRGPIVALLVACLFGAGCSPVPTAPKSTRHATKAEKDKGADTTSPTQDSAIDTDTDTTPVAATYTGRVLGLDGAPAVGVKVQAYLLSNNGGGLLSDRGSSYHVLADAGLSATTDAEGHFTITHPDGEPLNLEAVQEEDVKAIRMNVADGETDVTLQLAKTGTISGHVTAPEAPSVTNFQGVDVYVPGTGYVAKTDAAGNYTITNVPVGTFTLYAEKAGLGSASASGVAVVSEKTAAAPDLALSVKGPTITSVSPANGGHGTRLTITGENFGKSSGATWSVTVGGVAGVDPELIDDRTVKVTVPDNCGSQGVVLTVNQIASEPGAFTAIKKLALQPKVSATVLGKTLQYSVSATDLSEEAVASPTVSWAVVGGVGTVEDGLFTPQAVGTGEIQVTSGGVTAKQSIKVVASEADLPGNDALQWALDLVVAADGTMYFNEENYDLSIVRSDNTSAPYVGEDAEGTFSFSYLEGVAINSAGDMYVFDDGKVMRVESDRSTTFIAGQLEAYDVVDGSGAGARFDDLMEAGGAMAAAGEDLYLYDWNGNLRKVTPAGEVTTVAEGLSDMAGFVAGAADGTLWVYSDGALSKLAGDALTPVKSGLAGVTAMTVAPDGALIIAKGAALSRVAADGTVTALSVGQTFTSIKTMAFAPDGTLRVIDDSKGRIFSVDLP